MTADCVAGVDGCKGGWICVHQRACEEPRVTVFPRFELLVDALPDDAIIAVDMPIGLPERTGHGGRGPERLVRPLLGERQSSVFSIPPRAAVLEGAGPFASIDDWNAAHARASALAREFSDPPRSVSIQAFGIFPKICELDRVLDARPELCARVIESHPEVAFWRLNGGQAMRLPKKIKGMVNPAGMEERRALLAGHGLAAGFLYMPAPKGAAGDDFLDACAMLVIARRHAAGETTPFPDPPGRDERGVPLAIWA